MADTVIHMTDKTDLTIIEPFLPEIIPDLPMILSDLPMVTLFLSETSYRSYAGGTSSSETDHHS